MKKLKTLVRFTILTLLVLTSASCVARNAGPGGPNSFLEQAVPATRLALADTAHTNHSIQTSQSPRADSAAFHMMSPDGTDLTRLTPWREAVGQPVKVRSSEATDTPLDSLLVVTWNVHVGGGDIPGFVDDLRSGDLTGEPVDHFVLLLQEAFRSGMDIPTTADDAGVPARIASVPPSGDREGIVETSRQLDLNLAYVPSMRNGFTNGGPPEDRGNAILSTLPLTDPSAIELPFESQRRVSVAAQVQGMDSTGSPWSIKTISVHLDTRSRWSRLLDSFGPARLRQAQGLVDALSLEGPTVLGGDLNTWFFPPLEQTLSYLLERFPDTPRTQTSHTFQAAGLVRLHLDHLLHRLPPPYRAGRVERADSRYGSDHFPVMGWIHFSE